MPYRVTALALFLYFAPPWDSTGAAAQEARPSPLQETPRASEPRESSVAREVPPIGQAPATVPAPTAATGSRPRRASQSVGLAVKIIERAQIVASGERTIGDLLQKLLVQSNAVNTAVNEGNEGSTTLGLRGLGSQRTLVLVNGRRTVSGRTSPDASVDLGSIPSAAIERIEVLAGNGSAVYGADAVGGVVNLVTRTAADGTEVGGSAGISEHGDGAVYDVSLATGAASRFASIAVAAGFYHQADVMAHDRAFSSASRAYRAGAGEYTVGSISTPTGVFGITNPGVTDPSATPLYNDLVTAYPDATAFVHDPTTGRWRPLEASDLYDAGAAGYLVTPQQRLELYATGALDIGVARVHVESSYVDRRSEQLFAADSLNTSNQDVVSAQSMYNPFGVDLGYVTRRVVESGGRRIAQDVGTWRIVGRLEGGAADAREGWAWDLSTVYASSDSSNEDHRIGSLAENSALGPSAMVNGEPACLTGSAVLRCVPLDLLGTPGSITPDQLASIMHTVTGRASERLLGVHASAGGGLFSLRPDRPVSLEVGYDYRLVSGGWGADPLVLSGVELREEVPLTLQSYRAHEGYAELSIPIAGGTPGAEDVEGMVAARLFDHDRIGIRWAYQLGLRWTVVPGVTIRGAYGTGPREPSISELYRPVGGKYESVADPCATEYTTQCAADHAFRGVVHAQAQTAVGGNRDLDPEAATSLTLGVVVRPREGLSVTLEYYRTAIDDVIGGIGAAQILHSCYASATPELCELVHRDTDGVIDRVRDLDRNAGSLATDGIDLGLGWALATELGRFDLGLEANWLHALDRTFADGTVVHGKGTFDLAQDGIGGVYPSFRFDAGVSYVRGSLTAALGMRYIGSFEECGDPLGSFAAGGRCYLDSTYVRTVGAYQVYDLHVSYALDTPAGRTLVAVGVDNVLDREPERIYDASAAASDPTAYDYLGRYLFGRVVQTF